MARKGHGNLAQALAWLPTPPNDSPDKGGSPNPDAGNAIALPGNPEYGLRTKVYVYGSDIYLLRFWLRAPLAVCSPGIWRNPVASTNTDFFVAIFYSSPSQIPAR